MKIWILFAIICSASLHCQIPKSSSESPKESALEQETVYPLISEITKLETIAFGSCNRSDQNQILWDDVINARPDLWIWLGDNIYGDSDNMKVLASKYDRQNRNKGYVELRSQVPIIGIWDDHDYGANNAGKEFSAKKESRDLMFKFLDLPPDHAAWQREGGYQTYVVQQGAQEVRIILLDSRYFRDEPTRDPKSNQYVPNETGTILGEVQWTWLEDILTQSTADIHIIGNGIQVIPEDHPYEKWHNFPLERIRLFDLIADNQVQNPILLSGDRHISEVSRIYWKEQAIYEITSSGLTHSYEEVGNEPNRYRISQLVSQKSFATLQIDWSQPAHPKISTRLHGNKGEIFDQVNLDFE